MSESIKERELDDEETGLPIADITKLLNTDEYNLEIVIENLIAKKKG